MRQSLFALKRQAAHPAFGWTVIVTRERKKKGVCVPPPPSRDDWVEFSTISPSHFATLVSWYAVLHLHFVEGLYISIVFHSTTLSRGLTPVETMGQWGAYPRRFLCFLAQIHCYLPAQINLTFNCVGSLIHPCASDLKSRIDNSRKKNSW